MVLLQDVHAAAPGRGRNAVRVVAGPVPHQDAVVILGVDLRGAQQLISSWHARRWDCFSHLVDLFCVQRVVFGKGGVESRLKPYVCFYALLLMRKCCQVLQLSLPTSEQQLPVEPLAVALPLPPQMDPSGLIIFQPAKHLALGMDLQHLSNTVGIALGAKLQKSFSSQICLRILRQMERE